MKLIVAIGVSAYLAVYCSTALGAKEMSYVGGEICSECHQDEAAAWSGSHHDLAMQEARDETVLGDFNDRAFDYYGETTRFLRRGSAYLVRTLDSDGTPREFEVSYTFGVYPLQQYLVAFEDGRLQALPFAWDTRTADDGGQRWFHLYPDERVNHESPLFWTKPAQNWNYVCAECHSTDLKRGYDAADDTYLSTWSEIDVSCEACHGPGSTHVAWAQEDNVEGDNPGLAADLSRHGTWVIDSATGIARNREATNRAQINSCARCHARRIPLSEEFQHGADWTDTYRPQVLREGLYYADGQIDDEVYVWGSFVQSRMYAAGVTCSDCHDAHSLELRAEGNAMCGTCHASTRFDTPNHHFHEPGTDGAQCVSCHMPAKTYMVNDPRRDHGFRVPRPDLAGKTGSPNACQSCHLGRSPEWAAAEIAARLPGAAGRDHFGIALNAARNGALDAEKALIDLADDDTQPAIARATAALHLQDYLSPSAAQSLALLTRDDDPLLRVNAATALETADPRLRIQILPRLLTDPALMVRIQAARSLADIPPEQLKPELQSRLEAALDEYVAVQQNNIERAESWLNLGNLAARRGDIVEAREWFEGALERDPALAAAWVNLADLHRLLGDEGSAEQTLAKGLQQLPEDASLQHARGLLLVRQGKSEDALDALREAVRLEPENIRFRYVYAIALNSTGDTLGAIDELEAAYARRPADVNVLSALVDLNRRRGNVEDARRYAADLVTLMPWNPSARSLFEQLGG